MRQGTHKLQVLGYEQLPSIAAATRPAAVPKGTVAFLVQASGQPVRWRADGTNPTATVGMRLLITEVPEFYEFAPNNVSFIQEAATGVVNLTYLGE